MIEHRPEPPAPTFAGMMIAEVLIVFSIFVGAIIAVKLNAISLADLQEWFS